MIDSSILQRSVYFACLFGPPRTLSRQDGMEVHSRLCERLGVDDISFRYSTTGDEESRGFSVIMERAQGRGEFSVTIDNKSINDPVRLHVGYSWPPSREHVYEDIDLASEATFDAIGSGMNRVLIEARIRAQVEARGGPAADYLARNVLNLTDKDFDLLQAQPNFFAIKYEIPAGHPSLDDPLSNPKRDMSIEVLREDPRVLYLEFMSQWPQLAHSGTQGGAIEIDVSKLRPLGNEPPSAYVKEAMEYLTKAAMPLFSRSQPT